MHHSLLTDLIIKRRTTFLIWRDASATKKAIGLIERWWRRGRVRIMFRRHPYIVPLLRRLILPHVVRIRLRRKRRSASLIVTFLQDSTGMSKTVRAMYGFRTTVIRLQRWIRSWIAVQQCRMRILWLKCERMFREKMLSERGNAPKDEVKHPTSLFVANYFTETVEEIASRRKKLGRLLDDQEHARAQRQFQAEALQRKKEAEDRRRRKRALRMSARLQMDSTKTVGTTTIVPVAIPGKGSPPPKKHGTPWHIRIRSSASNVKIYEQLREVLGRERRRHTLHLVQRQRIGQECVIGTSELRRFLKNPGSYEGAAEISKKLAEVQVVARSPAQ